MKFQNSSPMFIGKEMEIYTPALLWHVGFVNIQYIHWRPTKVETTGATWDYETLILRLLVTFLYFETKKVVVQVHYCAQ